MVSSAASIVRTRIEAGLANRIPGALTLRPAIEPEVISFGIPELDERRVGILRGCLTEICGPASSGRTTLMLAAMREVTQRGECCALVDASSAFDPYSGAAVIEHYLDKPDVKSVPIKFSLRLRIIVPVTGKYLTLVN